MLIERLVDTLRMPQSGPGIHAQVFLCFRVLLLRMSGHHITSMWPIIVSEIVQVMIHIEHNLSTDSEEFRCAKIFYNIIMKFGWINLHSSFFNKFIIFMGRVADLPFLAYDRRNTRYVLCVLVASLMCA